ncbi:MAG: 1-acyl-sn-glycerol-3-phosphate acyltransferase [Saprospiraceae bacterium]|nr:1-acyl-sn-glycerol-3-phosphate acyltransferase [Saprospiraceae bacterium]
MVYRIIYYFANIILRVYYRKIHVYGLDTIPKDKPLLIVSNHPSGFLEPIIMACTFPIDLHFLVRGDLFEKPWLKHLLIGTNQVPIYRFRDGFAGLRNNQKTIAKTIEVLRQNKAIIIFAEGGTSADQYLRPFQKGMARMAFQTLDGSPDLDLHILPVGVTFSASTLPGNEVVLSVGKAFSVNSFYTSNARDAKEKMDELNQYAYDRVKENMIHLEDREEEASLKQAWMMYNKPGKTSFLPRIVKGGGLFSYLKEVEKKLNSTQPKNVSVPDALRVSPVLAFRSHLWYWLALPLALVGMIAWFLPVAAGFGLAKSKVKQREFVASLQASASAGFSVIYILLTSLIIFFVFCWCMMLWWWLILWVSGIAAIFFWEQNMMVVYQDKH